MTAGLTTFFGLLGALLVLAFVANRLSKCVLVLLAAIRAKDLVPHVAPVAVAVQSSESFPA